MPINFFFERAFMPINFKKGKSKHVLIDILSLLNLFFWW